MPVVQFRGIAKGFLMHVQLSQRGEYQAMERNELVAAVWRDEKDVVTLSTPSNRLQNIKTKKAKAKGWHMSVSCPEAIYKYNRYMGGVDKGDQLRKYYQFGSSVRRIISTSFGLYLTPPSHFVTVQCGYTHRRMCF